MKVWIKDNHKILNFDGGKEIDLGTVFTPYGRMLPNGNMSLLYY
jgi:hypothetical protein